MHKREDIRRLLNQINDAWLKARPEDIASVLEDCFDEAMVIKGPGFQEMGRGREACIGSYVDFVRQATVRECRLSEPEIDVSGATAVATYSWEMSYAINGQEYHESGHDLFVFTRGQAGWRAVWRAVLPSTQQ